MNNEDLHWPSLGLFDKKIAGAHFYRSNISSIAQNNLGNEALVFCCATLVLQNDNAHDENAVLVQIDSSDVGHLPRHLAQEYRRRLLSLDLGTNPRKLTCDAVITAGIITSDTTYDYIIELDLNLDTTPASELAKYPEIDRRDTCLLEDQNDGTFRINVWLANGVRENMHKSMAIDGWAAITGTVSITMFLTPRTAGQDTNCLLYLKLCMPSCSETKSLPLIS